MLSLVYGEYGPWGTFWLCTVNGACARCVRAMFVLCGTSVQCARAMFVLCGTNVRCGRAMCCHMRYECAVCACDILSYALQLCDV